MLEQQSEHEFKSALVTVAELTHKIDTLLASVETAKAELKAQYKVLRRAQSRLAAYTKKTIPIVTVILDTGEAFVMNRLDSNLSLDGRVRITPTLVIKQGKYECINL
jgi:uncharacterized small protein (DUF1192 family)